MRAVGRACPPPGIIALGEHAPRIAVGAGRKWGGRGRNAALGATHTALAVHRAGMGSAPGLEGKARAGVCGARQACVALGQNVRVPTLRLTLSLATPSASLFLFPCQGRTYTRASSTHPAPLPGRLRAWPFFFFSSHKKGTLSSPCVSLSLSLSPSPALLSFSEGAGGWGGVRAFFFFFSVQCPRAG